MLKFYDLWAQKFQCEKKATLDILGKRIPIFSAKISNFQKIDGL